MPFALNSRFAALLFTAGLATVGCSKLDKKDSTSESAAACSGSGSGSSADCAATATGSGSASGSTSGSAEGVDAADDLGLFDYCKWAPTDAGGCMTCTPRDLDLVKCAKDLKEGFDPAKDCKHDVDLQAVSCDVGGDAEFSWALGEETKSEKLYAQMPLILAGAKLFLGNKLAEDPAKKAVVIGALDILSSHSKELFNGDDVGPAAQDIAVLAKKVKPNLSDVELKSVTAQVTNTINTLEAKRKSGEIADADVLSLLAGFITAMPADVLGKDLGGIDINALATGLSGGGGLEGLISLLGGSFGSGSGSGSDAGSDAGSASGAGSGS